MEHVKSGLAKGRPREFCVNLALRKAMGVFWARGYEATSMSDLTDAMGIAKPSLYAAFGNKEALFHQALNLYEIEKVAYTHDALKQSTARTVAEYLLRGAVEAQTGADDPKGCLGVISLAACGADVVPGKAHLIARRALLQSALIERFRQAQLDGDLPGHVNPSDLTLYLYAILQGMAVQAASGATRADLERVVQTSMLMWPNA